MSDLPKELFADILSRLPVKPLLRFRSVCRPWRALIDSQDFVKLHLDRSLETKANQSLIIRDEHLHSIDFDSLEGLTVHAAKIKHHPLWCQDYGTEVWGSSNGLLCMSNSLDTLVLWNPSTRKSRKLPYASIEFKDLSKFVDTRIYGFGYDENSDDYKVVRIVVLKGSDGNVFDNEVKVYSLKSHAWHRVQKFPNYPNLKRTAGVSAGGSLHWVVTEGFFARMAGSIVAFDLGREKFSTVPQPEYSDMNFLMGLQSLGGCLSIACNYYLEQHVDVWVMKVYGVKESWSKLISIGHPDGFRSFQYLRPVAYSKSGGEVLLEQDAEMLLWCDLEKKTAKYVKIRGGKDLVQVDMCAESLVPLDDVGESCGKKQKEQEERNVDDFLSKGFKLVL